jgi:uncharacterized membrane protein
MPGIGTLNDKEFIRAFQVIDRVIQNNQPIFLLVWVGSVVALLASATLAWEKLEEMDRLLLIFATAAYLLGVQLPTLTINIPLNNKLQTLNVDSMEMAAQEADRRDFETRWNRWNVIRTVAAILVSTLLATLLFRF